MDATKLHLIFNYFPLIGMLVGPFILLYGSGRSNVKAQKIGLGILVLTAILTLLVFGTGEVAGKGSDLMVGQLWTNIQQHKASALPAFAVIESVGIFALYGWINLMRQKALAVWVVPIIILLSLAAIGLTGRTAYLGRHIYTVAAPVVK